MKNVFCLNRWLVLAVLLAGIPLAIAAKGLDLPPTPAGFKMGMEVELTPDKLANLVSFFDFAKFEQGLQKEHGYVLTSVIEVADANLKRLDPELGSLTKNYLRNNPAAFRALPEELRAELSAGLNLKSVVLQERQALLGADQKPMQKRSGLILPGAEEMPKPPAAVQVERPKLILPGQSSAPKPGEMDSALFHGEGGLQVPNKLEWEKLYARWENLPEKTRNAAIKLDLLGPKEKAYLFHVSLRVPTQFAPLGLRSDLGEKDAELWKKIEWKPHGDAVEFVHREPVGSPQEFLGDLRAFARRAGVEREIFQPELAEMGKFLKDENGNILYDAKTGKALRKAKAWGSFHYHYSWEGHDLANFGEQLNLNLLAHRLKAGILSDLSKDGYVFTTNTGARGLMRMIDPSHLEVRSHLNALELELGHQLDLLFRKGPEEAASALALETSELIDHNTARKMAGGRLGSALRKIALSPKRLAELEQELRHGGFDQKLTAAVDLSAFHPENPLLADFRKEMLEHPAQLRQAATLEKGLLLAQFARQSSPETNLEVFRKVVKLAETGSDDDARLALTFLLNHFLDSQGEIAPLLTPFFRAATQRVFSDETAPLVLTALDLLEGQEQKLAIPIIKNLLLHNKGVAIEDKIGQYIGWHAEKVPGIISELAPAYFKLPEPASAQAVQEAAFTRLLEGGHFDWERELLLRFFASRGEIQPGLAGPFGKWLGSHADAHSVAAAYQMSEHTPELRSVARGLVEESLNLKKSILLSVFQRYTPKDRETLEMLRRHGDGTDWLAQLVQSTYYHLASQPACEHYFSQLGAQLDSH